MKFSAGHFRLAALALFCPGAILAQGWTLTPAPTKNWRALAMGTGVSWIYSIAGTMLPGVFPATMRGHDGAVPVYFEAAAVITVLVLLGQVLELKAREQTSGAIRALLDLSPKMARRIRPDDSDEDVSLDQVVVGDRLRVRPGERVPVDGEILEGRSAIDESMQSGLMRQELSDSNPVFAVLGKLRPICAHAFFVIEPVA